MKIYCSDSFIDNLQCESGPNDCATSVDCISDCQCDCNCVDDD